MTDNGFAVIYSASKGQKAADGPPGGNSPFTQQFLNALAYHGDELSDLFRRIGQEMGSHDSATNSVFRRRPQGQILFQQTRRRSPGRSYQDFGVRLMPGQSLQGNHCRQVD